MMLFSLLLLLFIGFYVEISVKKLIIVFVDNKMMRAISDKPIVRCLQLVWRGVTLQKCNIIRQLALFFFLQNMTNEV
jgi:hypothetical protein